jgi:hypothetical protein
MTRGCSQTIRVWSGAIVAAAMLGPLVPIAAGQAFVPAQGEGSVAVLFQNQFFKYHLVPTKEVDIGHIYSNSLLADMTYGLTDRVAIGIGLPWVATRYNGAAPHPLADFSGPNPVDDGTWHSTAQDVRVDLRYNVTRNFLNAGVVVTPFVGSVTPSHDYTDFAHAGFGRDLNEVQLGASVAKLFEQGVPGLLLQGSYSYGVVEQVVDVSHNRSLASLEAAYFATPSLRLLALASGQVTHGGIDFYGSAISRVLLTTDQFIHHDQIVRENILTLGGGLSYSLNESLDLFGSAMHTVAQRNGHALDLGLSAGLTWSFTTSRAKARANSSAENSLARCLCEKGAK